MKNFIEEITEGKSIFFAPEKEGKMSNKDTAFCTQPSL